MKTDVIRRGNITYVPFPNRQRSLTESRTLDAATEWLLVETGEPASIHKMRALAKAELVRPRDSQHKKWAELFLRETEQYTEMRCYTCGVTAPEDAIGWEKDVKMGTMDGVHDLCPKHRKNSATITTLGDLIAAKRKR